MRRRAFATLVTTDSYLPGALVLASSIRRHHPPPCELIVLCTPATVSARTLKALRLAFDVVVGVEPIALESVLADRLAGVLPDVPGAQEAQAALNARLVLMGRLDLGAQGGCALTKLHLWRLTAYERIVYLDADMLVVGDLTDLLYPASQPLDTRFHPGGRALASSLHLRGPSLLPPPLLAAPDIGWPDTFNTGLLSLQPSWLVYEWIRAFLADLGSWDGADQGLLNDFFGAPLDPSPPPPSVDALTPSVPLSSSSSSADEASLPVAVRRRTTSLESAPRTRTGLLADPRTVRDTLSAPQEQPRDQPLGGRQFWGTWDPTAPGLLDALELWRGPGWTPISFKYNVTVQGGYTHAPALRRYGSDVRAAHFVGHGNKPWDHPLPPRSSSGASSSSHPSEAPGDAGPWGSSTDYMAQWHDLFRQEYGDPWRQWHMGASSSEPESSSYFEVVHTDRGIEVVERPARTCGIGDGVSYVEVIWGLVDKLERERTAAQYAPGGVGPVLAPSSRIPSHWRSMPISPLDPLEIDAHSRPVPFTSSSSSSLWAEYNPLANPLAPAPAGRYGGGLYVSLPLGNRVGLLPPSLAHLAATTGDNSPGSESASEHTSDLFTPRTHAALHGAAPATSSFARPAPGAPSVPFDSRGRRRRRRRRAATLALPVSAAGESTADEDEDELETDLLHPASPEVTRRHRSRPLWLPPAGTAAAAPSSRAEGPVDPKGLPPTLRFRNAWDGDPVIDRFAERYQRTYMGGAALTDAERSPPLRCKDIKGKGRTSTVPLAPRSKDKAPEQRQLREGLAFGQTGASSSTWRRAGGTSTARRDTTKLVESDVSTDVESDAFSGSVFGSDSTDSGPDGDGGQAQAEAQGLEDRVLGPVGFAPPYPATQSSVDRCEWLLRARRTRRRPSWRKQTPSGTYLRRAGAEKAASPPPRSSEG